jgi:raffinose/stachyose/melibiose transport system substrate-binding protein
VQIAAMTNTVDKNLRPVSQWESYLPADWQSKINSTMLTQTQDAASDSTLYELPMGSIGDPVMYSNQALLAKAGITAEPTTGAELAADVKKIKAAEPGIEPVTFSGEGWFQEDILFALLNQINPHLSDEVYQGKVAWNSPQMIKALTEYQNMFSAGTLDTGVLSQVEADADDAFNSGKAAFLVEGSWDSSVLSASYRKANGINISDVGGGAFPAVMPGGSPAVRTYAEGGLAIPKDSKHVAQAAKFIQFMTLQGQGESTWAPDLVLVPSLNGYTVPSSVLTSPAARSGYAAIQKLIGDDVSGRGVYTTNFTSNVLDPSLANVARGHTTPKAEAAALQSAWVSGRYPVS